MPQLKSLIPTTWLNNMAGMAQVAPPGCFVEVGVYQGGSAQYLYHIAQAQNRALHLFDTFSGIPCSSNQDHHNVGDFCDVNISTLKAAMPNAVYHVGMFPSTLTDDVRDIAFIHADVDQYESQKAIDKLLWPRVVPGGIMLFDDYPYLEGILQAVNEDFSKQLRWVKGYRPFVIKE